jgi:hypothetical protein
MAPTKNVSRQAEVGKKAFLNANGHLTWRLLYPLKTRARLTGPVRWFGQKCWPVHTAEQKWGASNEKEMDVTLLILLSAMLVCTVFSIQDLPKD